MIWEVYFWRLGEGFCIIKVFIIEMFVYVFIFIIIVFIIERWVVICYLMRF